MVGQSFFGVLTAARPRFAGTLKSFERLPVGAGIVDGGEVSLTFDGIERQSKLFTFFHIKFNTTIRLFSVSKN
jgi:hypothetical protein